MPGDIAGEGHWLELNYDEPANQWTLRNPAKGIAGQVDRIATAEGTSDVLVMPFVPPITDLADGMRIYVRATAPNGSLTLSIKIDDLPDAIIGKGANQTLATNDIAGAGHIQELQWDELHTVWELQIPGTWRNDSEQQTFLHQSAEAQAYLAGSTASVPLLSSLAVSHGVALDELVQRVLNKPMIYSALGGKILGQKKTLQNRRKACSSIEEIETVETVIKVPRQELNQYLA